MCISRLTLFVITYVQHIYFIHIIVQLQHLLGSLLINNIIMFAFY